MVKTIRMTGSVRTDLVPMFREGIKYIHLMRHPRDVAKSYERYAYADMRAHVETCSGTGQLMPVARISSGGAGGFARMV